ncbi:MAG: DNA polymerase III subunit beta [Syntrophales bacterium]|nr:DNA polymerase III subunit beta [Syntrophales bacterium]
MELSIDRNTFLAGVQRTLGVVEKKTILPILNNVLVRTRGDYIRIIATDREISLIADYEANVVSEGDITLSARKLYEMIREIQGDIIYFKKDEHNVVTITCGKVVYKILGVSADDFPNIGDDINIELLGIDRNIIHKLIRNTFSAMSTDEMKRNLNGIFFKIEKDEGGGGLGTQSYLAKMVGTDGFRLAISSAAINGTEFCGLDKGIIIPRKGVVEIKRLIEDDADGVMMGVKGGMCVIKTKNAILKVSLVDDGYPDYRRVIPSDRGDSVCFNKDIVLRALKRMNVVSSEGCDGVIIKLVKDMMVMSSSNPDVGEANEEVGVLYNGEEVEVGYNIKFLIDAIEVIDEEKAAFDVGTGVRPGIIRALDDDNYMCAVMPMRF